MQFKNLAVEEKDGGIFVITINRPKVLNALNSETVREIESAVAGIAQSPGARALLITGAGDRAFAAGADIRELRELTPLGAGAFSSAVHRAFRAIEASPVPAIAAVRGYCLGGGCELALSCDWIVAATDAVFGLPEVTLGVIPGAGGTQRLSRLVGPARALELVTTGRRIGAEEAEKIGLVNHVWPAADLMERALAMAGQIAANGPVAVRQAKRAVVHGQALDMESACVLESQLFAQCFATDDREEGMAAFAEKRSPRFRGA